MLVYMLVDMTARTAASEPAHSIRRELRHMHGYNRSGDKPFDIN